ncbi:hypothetical protein HK107_00045 [Parvularcula sp. ZS-1/3]|uniref:TonB C-terminal domain-containing protein n=1 Tax=Parvularcula mediterranea TaxID=2732508 RepID=A0A7Y3RIG8_9PROT|nr:hypothetical protein [Parvularcula mediterranea]NNU14710.1 hypothetical protein [Parvularcula mediterranea]
MFRDDVPVFGFALVILAGVVVIMLLRSVSQPPSPIGQASAAPLPERQAQLTVATYRSVGVEAGHRLPCDGPGASQEGPASTEPVRRAAVCRIPNPPNRISIPVTYDVEPHGIAANIQLAPGTPACFAPVIEETVRAWRYCPKKVRGEPQWRYDEGTILTFVRTD